VPLSPSPTSGLTGAGQNRRAPGARGKGARTRAAPTRRERGGRGEGGLGVGTRVIGVSPCPLGVRKGPDHRAWGTKKS
jgi:hypothetical protein